MAALVRQLLQADKVIAEQQLGWSWSPPSDALFVPSSAEGGAAGGAAGAAGGAAGQGGDGAQQEAQDAISEEEAARQAAERELQERLHDPRYSGALALLVDEAGFLVEAKTRNMLERLSKDEAGLIAAESIVRALGVADGAGFTALVDALSADSSIDLRAKVGRPLFGCRHGVRGARLGRRSDAQWWWCRGVAQGLGATAGRLNDGDGQKRAGTGDANRGPVLVHPDDVIRRLRAYVELENSSPARAGMAGPSRAAGAVRRAAELEQEFWVRMTHVINDKGTRVWNALEKQLTKYLALLQARAGSLSDVESLQHQNAELRTLLNQYLSSRINEELQIPPTQII